MSDEDKMIKKLEEHRDTIELFIEIGKIHGIDVRATTGNDSRGDFMYPLEKEAEYIKGIDEYLLHKKYRMEEGNDDEGD